MKRKFYRRLNHWEILFSLVVFICVLLLLLFGIQRLSASAETESLENMSESIIRNTVQCYAIEGKYPDDIAYLAEHYNVVLNEDKYVYHYTFLGDNIMPQVFVFLR